MNNDLEKEREKYQNIGLFKKPSKKLIFSLDLMDNEIILINLKVFPTLGIHKNEKREPTAKNLILTNKRIIFFSLGWVMKFNESISYDEIVQISVNKKWLISADFPVIIIKTETNAYQIFLLGLSFKKKLRKIDGIINCIKIRNPNIDIQMEITREEDNFVKEVLDTEVKFENPFKH